MLILHTSYELIFFPVVQHNDGIELEKLISFNSLQENNGKQWNKRSPLYTLRQSIMQIGWCSLEFPQMLMQPHIDVPSTNVTLPVTVLQIGKQLTFIVSDQKFYFLKCHIYQVTYVECFLKFIVIFCLCNSSYKIPI